MNIKSKKILAREFLIFIVMVVFGVIIFACLYFYNSYQENKIDHISELITNKEFKIDSLQNPVNIKIERQDWYYKEITKDFNFTIPQARELKTFWSMVYRIAKNDSINYRWNNQWSDNVIKFHNNIGFNTPKELEEFIIVNTLSENDSLKLKKVIDYKDEIYGLEKQKENRERKIISDWRMKDWTIAIIISLICIFFVFRYLFYAIKWSLRTLKS